MVFLDTFKLSERQDEELFMFHQGNLEAYDSKYPFHVFRYRDLPEFTFTDITILYGGNGSGKTTILNVIAEKLHLSRTAPYNRSSFFEDYLDLCRFSIHRDIPGKSAIITSDDVFDYLLKTRELQSQMDSSRSKLFDQYEKDRYGKARLTGLDNYDAFARICDAKDMAPGQYVRGQMRRSVKERSNGESALKYFTDHIDSDALYLLDEPENSLSAELQLELKQFIEDSARFYRCQFIMSTHSPFLLSMAHATVYDLDADPPESRPWTKLKNIKIYFDFFKSHKHEFTEQDRSS